MRAGSLFVCSLFCCLELLGLFSHNKITSQSVTVGAERAFLTPESPKRKSDPLPELRSVLAVLKKGPRPGISAPVEDIKLLQPYLGAEYRYLNPELTIKVYLFFGKRDFVWPKAAFNCDPLLSSWNLTNLTYKNIDSKNFLVLDGAKGQWLLFEFPDRYFDVCGFVRAFVQGLDYFSSVKVQRSLRTDSTSGGEGPSSARSLEFPAVLGLMP